MRDDIENRFDAREDEPQFPTKVTVAGISWIVFGGLIVVNLLILLAMIAASSRAGGGDRDRTSGAVAVGGCTSVLLGLFAAGFIFVGVQSVRGTAPGTVANGVGSIIFGVLNFIPLVILLVPSGRFPPGIADYIQAGMSSFFGLALIAVGALAIAGAAEYKVWRQFQKAKERWEWDQYYARRRQRRREEPEDLPPRRRKEEPEEESPPPPRRRPEKESDQIQRRPRRKDEEDD